MRIVNCPKGGKMPIGYCRESCLNYRTESDPYRGASSKKGKSKYGGSILNARETEPTGCITGLHSIGD